MTTADQQFIASLIDAFTPRCWDAAVATALHVATAADQEDLAEERMIAMLFADGAVTAPQALEMIHSEEI